MIEYRIVDKGQHMTLVATQAWLNDMQAEGWELVLFSDWLMWWIFKREKPTKFEHCTAVDTPGVGYYVGKPAMTAQVPPSPPADDALVMRLRDIANGMNAIFPTSEATAAEAADRIAALSRELEQAEARAAELEGDIATLQSTQQIAFDRANQAEARSARRLLLLRKLERWANDRVGESWYTHDAVNPVLFDEVMREFADSGGTDAIDAALAAPAGDADVATLIAELIGLCHSALISNPATWGRADFAKLFKACDKAAAALASAQTKANKFDQLNNLRITAMRERDAAEDRATKAEAALAENGAAFQAAQNETLLALRKAEAALAAAANAKLFPMQYGPPIPWKLAETIYAGYAAVHGTGQSLRRLSERGGFDWAEISLWWRDSRTGNRFREAIDAALREQNPGPEIA